MMPIQVVVLGTAVSTPIIPDFCLDPFNIGIGVAIASGGTGTTFWAVEHCFDYSTVMSPTWNGSTGVTWFPNSGLSGGTTVGADGTTASPLNGNYAFPVAAIRLNVYSATATTMVVMNLMQAGLAAGR
jgi:hypothetical protein